MVVKAQKILQSFKCAIDGVVYALRTQRNMRFHFFAGAVAIIAGWWAGLNRVEFSLLFLVITLVMTAEMFNTAVESVVDILVSESHPMARAAKDVAAGAVIIAAIGAVVIGVFLLCPRLLEKISF